MRLATVRVPGGTSAVRIDEDVVMPTGDPDVGVLLARPDWREHAVAASGPAIPVGELDYAPVVPRPGKIVCVGLNYKSHILEMGRELPIHPTMFAKFPAVLTGAFDDIVLPAVSSAMDWEAELAVVVGARVRNVTPRQAAGAIAGYSVLNDVSARDWQFRTVEWLQGKIFEATTPFGPYLVTPEEVDPAAEITTLVDEDVVQRSSIADLVFGPADLISYLSAIITLEPGDVIATGTPGGVGHARKPPRYLTDGAVLTTRISGIGECRNTCRQERSDGG